VLLSDSLSSFSLLSFLRFGSEEGGMLLLLLSSVKRSNNTPGGQLGHPGKTLDFFENPDHVIDIPIDHALLQDGHVYKSYGYMRRQVVDIKIQRVITEYRAEILEDQNGLAQ
jgi:hypothetical protein